MLIRVFWLPPCVLSVFFLFSFFSYFGLFVCLLVLFLCKVHTIACFSGFFILDFSFELLYHVLTD